MKMFGTVGVDADAVRHRFDGSERPAAAAGPLVPDFIEGRAVGPLVPGVEVFWETRDEGSIVDHRR